MSISEPNWALIMSLGLGLGLSLSLSLSQKIHAVLRLPLRPQLTSLKSPLPALVKS